MSGFGKRFAEKNHKKTLSSRFRLIISALYQLAWRGSHKVFEVKRLECDDMLKPALLPGISGQYPDLTRRRGYNRFGKEGVGVIPQYRPAFSSTVTNKDEGVSGQFAGK